MTEKIIDSFESLFLSKCWISDNGEISGRYGGLVRTVQETRSGEAGQRTVSWPVSSKVSHKECWEKEKNKELVPNSNYKSISYFEEISKKTPSLVSSDYIQYTQNVRLVLWLHIPLIGYSDNSIAHLFDAEIHDMFHQSKFDCPTKGLGKIETTLLAANDFETTIRQVFNKYNYDHEYQLFFYPYEALSYDIQIKWIMDPGCLLPAEGICKEPLPC